MQTKAETSTRNSVWRMLVVCISIFCVVSLWIVISFPDHVIDLWFYFVYMTIACTFFPLPTPQWVMLYGQEFNPLLIAILGGIGSCISGLIDYTLVTVAFRYERVARIKTTRTYLYIQRFFKGGASAIFVIIVIAAFTPIPFDPVKLLACATGYSIIGFVLAILVGRTPRYYLLAKLQLPIPRGYLLGSIVVLVAIEAIRRLVKRLRHKE